MNENVTPWVRDVLMWARIPGLERWFARLGIPIIGLLLTVTFIYLLGLVAGNLAGRRLVHTIESIILRIPLVKGIYGSARQLLDAFSVTGQRHFSRVVVIEYPRRGLWTIGFVTREARHALGGGEKVVPIFLPTTPNPTSGWMILVPIDELIELEMSVENGLKLVVSGGIVSPEDLGTLIRRPPPGDGDSAGA